MNKPLVSVIIPCYNVQDYLNRCIESVVHQTYPEIEIICVDNGSTDSTIELIEKWVRADNRISFLKESARGASQARNRGLTAAKGTYIQFLDADDVLSPDKIAGQMCTEGADLIVGPYIREREHDAQSAVTVAAERDIWLGLLTTRLGITSSNLWKKDAVMKVGGWNAELKSSQEYDLMFRMLKGGATVAFSDKVETKVYTRSGSISTASPSDNWGRFLSLRADIVRFLSARDSNVLPNAYYSALFDAIRMSYSSVPELALSVYRELIPSGFKPTPGPVNSKSYCQLYNLVGFRLAEKIKALVAR